MGKAWKEQVELEKEVKVAEAHVTVGATYQHYKGADKLYEVLGLGFFEADDNLCVIYRALYDRQLTFIRPLNIWLEMVSWHGQTVPRFKQVSMP